MKTNPTDKEWREHRNEPAVQEGQGSPQPAQESERPKDRLKDGSNDLQSGEQDPSSANSQKPGGERGHE